MHKGAYLDLSATPEAKVALDMLRAQAARGPYLHAGNMGRAPVRNGADVVRELPLSAAGRGAYAAAIDAWMGAGGSTPFLAPVRLAPAQEARIHDGMAELCRQRRLAAAAATGGHPTAAAAAGLEVALRRGRRREQMPKVLGHRPDRMAKDQEMWARARQVAAGRGQAANDALTSAIFHRLCGELLHKADRAAHAALSAALRADPATGLGALAEGRHGACARPLAKRRGVPKAAEREALARAVERLRRDQTTAMRPSGAGLRALLDATGRMSRQDRVARAADELRRSRLAEGRQERTDLCLLAQANAVLALGGI